MKGRQTGGGPRMHRRQFLSTAGAAASLGVTGAFAGCSAPPQATGTAGGGELRHGFQIEEGTIQLAGMLVAPHPEPVRAAVMEHRRELDRRPATYVLENDGELKQRSRDAAARFMGVEPRDVALTDSTTMGIGLVYNGVQLRPGQQLLTTDQDYHATHEALDLRAARVDVEVRQIRLFNDIHTATADALVDRLMENVGDRTRVLALTWVHSSTGLKLPVRPLADRLAEHNAGRPPEERALLCLDGVHGLGVEDVDVPDLGCDFFFAGTHKWIFAPRGTGVLWGRPGVQEQVRPTIPTFIRDGTWGGNLSPGGFKSFEHQWSMAEAFDFLEGLGGRRSVKERIHGLAAHLKEGLSGMDGVVLYTPVDMELSSGIVCFDVEGMDPDEVVERLEQQRIIASVTPYARRLARFSPGILNDHDQMERTLRAVRDLTPRGG